MKNIVLPLCLCLTLLLSGCAQVMAPQEEVALADDSAVSAAPSTAEPSIPPEGPSSPPEAIAAHDAYVEPLDFALEDSIAEFFSWKRDAIHERFGRDFVYFRQYDVYPALGLSFAFMENMFINTPEDEAADFRDAPPTEEVYNVRINRPYSGTIGSGLSMASSRSAVEAAWGAPPYDDRELGLWGYKLRNAYVFFLGDDGIDEMSVYPWRDLDINALVEDIMLVLPEPISSGSDVDERYGAARLAERKKVQETFLARLPVGRELCEWSSKWSSRERGWLVLDYLLEGIYVQGKWYSPNDTNEGLVAISGNHRLSGNLLALDHPWFRIEPDRDSVFENERAVVVGLKALPSKIEAEGVVSPDGQKTVLTGDDNMGFSNIYLFSRNGSSPPWEIEGGLYPHAYTWLNNRYVVYAHFWGLDIIDTDAFRTLDAHIAYHKSGSAWAGVDLEGQSIYYIPADTECFYQITYHFASNGDIVLGDKTDFMFDDDEGLWLREKWGQQPQRFRDIGYRENTLDHYFENRANLAERQAN
jgi:hypothetical protein